MNKIVIFTDFDGVLFDSVKEAYLLARYAYFDIPIKEKIVEEHYQKFRKYRYLITHSWNFYIILSLLEKCTNEDEFENLYNKFLNQGINMDISDFDEKYVQARETLIKDDYEFWDSLDIPFKFFYQIKELAENKEYKFIILTNKKRLPVKNKLEKYNAKNFELYANEELQQFKNKAEFISAYMKKNNFKEAFFIEDSISNLAPCKNNVSIKPILVDWGYISPKALGVNEQIILNKLREVI